VAKSSVRWTEEQLRCLFDLLREALKQLQRPLEHRDFFAITEAVNRRLGGTVNSSGVQFHSKGSHTMHTFVLKARKAEYEILERSVLGG